MQPSSEYIIALWERYLSNQATPAEVDALFQQVKDTADDELNYAYVKKAEQRLQQNHITPAAIPEWMVQAILKDTGPADPVPVKNRYIQRWYWAAAAVIILLGIGIYFYQQSNRPQSVPPVATITPDTILAPATNRAMITLADGSKIFLDSIGNGQLAQQGAVKLIKLANGEIAYQTITGQVLKEPQYNTLTNPRGSKVIDMQLSDGSHIWLNAGSSVTYPVAFTGIERKVELKGEGYFEVAKDPSKRFIVQAGGIRTEVLGTHFNVNAYDHERYKRVTLLEGRVRVIHNDESVMLKPGQQGVAGQEPLTINDKSDMEQVMAWRNGVFFLNHQRIEEVMQQVGDWYDVQISYPSGVPVVELYGEIGRDLSLTQVIQALKVLGVTCRLEGRKLLVGS